MSKDQIRELAEQSARELANKARVAGHFDRAKKTNPLVEKMNELGDQAAEDAQRVQLRNAYTDTKRE